MLTTQPLPALTHKPAEDWLTRRQAVKYLAERGAPISDRTLTRWASIPGRGPVYTAFHLTVRYLKADLDEWLRKAVRRVA